MINTDSEYSHGPEIDVQLFNPTRSEEAVENLGRKSTLIMQNANGITTIPIYNVEKTSANIVGMINAETQTEIYEYHGLQLLMAR